MVTMSPFFTPARLYALASLATCEDPRGVRACIDRTAGAVGVLGCGVEGQHLVVDHLEGDVLGLPGFVLLPDEGHLPR